MPLLKTLAAALSFNVLTIMAQLLSLLVATQALRVEELGAYLSISATSAIAFTLVGLGSGDILTAEVARDHKRASPFLNLALVRSAASFLVLVAPISYLEHLLVPSATFPTILLLNVNLLLCSRIVAIAENIEVAFGRSSRAAMIRFVYAVLQALAFACLFLLPQDARFTGMVMLTMMAGALSAAISVFYLIRPHITEFRLPALDPWKDSLQFMAGQLLAATTSNLDRVLATAILGETAAALYVLASRAAQIAAMPVTIFFRTMYHRFFAVVEAGDIAAEKLFLRQTLLQSTGIGTATAILASTGFWIATLVLLQDYQQAALPFVIMSAAMPLVAIYYCFGNQMHAHRQLWHRNVLDVSSVAIMAAIFALTSLAASPTTLAIALVAARAATAGLVYMFRART